ncbi:MAG: DUF2062 domain-containing protein [Ignavibacterium sp.]|nr:DUF2062 domain-containing protein [Ignavibacterium sp.]MDW8375268.1 DUF2062 domain-containing protein [Ignavibacteriales bacterium]
MNIYSKLKELREFKLSDLFVKEKIKKFINYEKELAHNPHKLALSVALGIFVGLTIPMGFQTIVAIPLALLLRVNILVVYLATLITNPFTAIFIYASMFKIGESITGNYIPVELIENLLNNFSIKQISQLGKTALENFLVGMTILTFILTPLSYYLVLLYVNRRKILKKKNKNY